METTRDLEVSSGFRGKLDTLKSRGLSKVHDIQCALGDGKVALRDGAKSQVTKVQSSMRTSPMKWAGIAAGSGFALGMIGRIARARAKRRYTMPTLVIVETSC